MTDLSDFCGAELAVELKTRIELSNCLDFVSDETLARLIVLFQSEVVARKFANQSFE